MKHSLVLALSLSLAAAPAALALETRTERISLRYLSANEAEQLLLPAPSPDGKGGVGERSVLPSGIVALAQDPQTASLTVSGTAEALDELKQIVRLIDVPRKRLRWTVTALKPDGVLKAAAAKPETDSVEIERLAREAEKRGGMLFRTELDGANGRAVRLFTQEAQCQRNLTLQGRVNGDRSITVMLSPSVEKDLTARRIPSGGSALFAPEGSAVLVIQVQILPEPKLD
jgi:hypothetical protein